MARVTFGAQQRQPRQRTRLQPQRRPQERRNWYEDPSQLLGWVRLAEALAAPKGLIARGVRAAQRWQLEQDAEARKEAIEVDQQLNMLRQGVKPIQPLPPLRGAGGQVLQGVEPTTPLPMPAMPAGEPVSRADARAMEPLLQTMRPSMRNAGGMPEAQAHLGEFFPQYVTLLGKRLQREQETGEPMMIPDWFREQTPQAAEPAPAAPAAAPEAGVEQPRYRQFNMQQKEAAEAKAKELDDYTAAMGLSTVNEVYEDFGKYAGAKGGRLDADDFADLWEQAKLMLERDPSYVDGLALDPVGTQRRLLSDTMAYFKFLNMGGDPAAAKRRQVKDETAEINLRRLKRREKEERDRAERKSRTGVRIVRDIPVGAPNWEDDLVQWGIWRDGGFDQGARGNVPSYLGHKDGGKYAAAANRAKKHLKAWLESPQGWDKPESQWSTWQRDAFKDESKEINRYRPQVDASDRTAGEEPSYDDASDMFEWTEEGGRKRTGTLSDVLKGRILTETEAARALKAGGLSDAEADAAIEEANKAKKSKTTQRTKNAWSVIQDFSMADLQGNKSDVEARLDTGFLTRNKWDRLTDSATQRKIREAINEILAAEEVENVPPKWINIANKINALGIRGL